MNHQWTVPEGKAVTGKLDQLLEQTIGQHGYWLINHLEYIDEDLDYLLKWHRNNVQKAKVHLNDLDSDFVKGLYKKIDLGRGRKAEL